MGIKQTKSTYMTIKHKVNTH